MSPFAKRGSTVLVDRGRILHEIRMAKATGTSPAGMGELEKAIKSAIAALQKAFDAAGFGALGKAMTADSVIRALPWDAMAKALGQGASSVLGRVSKDKAVEAFSKMVNADAVKMGLAGADRAVVDQALQITFTGIDQRAVDWAATQSSRLVKDITEELRQSIRDTMSQTMAGERDVRAAAAIIRQSIGLTNVQAGWVRKRFATAVDQAIKGGMTREQAVAQATKTGEAFSNRLLNMRAATIARTEAASSAVQGRLIGYQETFDSGLLDQSTATKTWLPDPAGACPICEDNASQGPIAYEDSFDSGDDAPPAHPNCECDIDMTADFGALQLPDWAQALVDAGQA